MHPFIAIILAGAFVCALVYGLRLKKKGLSPMLAALTLPVSAIFGIVLGKLVYVFSLFSKLYPRYGMAVFIRPDLTQFSFVGAAAGVILGVILCGRKHLKKALDAFAPTGALFAAVARAAEYTLGLHGVGMYMENESLCFFPLAVKNEWDEYFLAVFMISAFLYLLTSIFSFAFSKKTSKTPGLLFEMTLYHLCLAQILCESLRAQGMKWGFVRVEQLYCAVVCLFVIIRQCVCLRKKQVNKKVFPAFLPVLLLLVCAGILVFVEYALDKTGLGMLRCYAIMIATLVFMSGMALFTARKRNRNL